MTFDITQGIDLSKLDARDDNKYLYAERQDDNALGVSDVRLKGRLLWFIPFGTSKQHSYGFDRLKTKVYRQYGFILTADDRATGLITIGSLRKQIRDAQKKNAKQFNEILDNINVEYAKLLGEEFGQEQKAYAKRFAKAQLADGKNLAPDRFENLNNNLNIRWAERVFDKRYGAAEAKRFRNWVRPKWEGQEKLTNDEYTRFNAVFRAERAVMELGARIEAKLGGPAAQVAVDLLAKRVTDIMECKRSVPSELSESGYLPQAWVDDAVDAALAHYQGRDKEKLAKNPSRQATQRLKSLAWGDAEALKRQHPRIVKLEQKIFGTASDALLRRSPVALFLPGSHADDDVYQTCDDLAAIYLDYAQQRAAGPFQGSGPLNERLNTLKDLVEAGQVLEKTGIAKELAEYVLHIWATLREMGIRDHVEFLPPKDQLALAKQAVALEKDPGFDKRTIGQLLRLELTEKAAARNKTGPVERDASQKELAIAGPRGGNSGAFSPRTLELVKKPSELEVLKRHDVTLEVYALLRGLGAENAKQVVECTKLSVPPQSLKNRTEEEKRRLQPWIDKGFTQVEAIAYCRDFNSPDDIMDFQGSLLKPKQIKAYQRSDVPYTALTRLGRFNDFNQIGDHVFLDKGSSNKVYKTKYRDLEDPNGFTTRVFKFEPKAWEEENLGRLGLATFRNCLCKHMDRELGFNVLTDMEVGMVGEKLGVSMSYAKGAQARRHITGEAHEVPVTKGSKYAELLKYKDLEHNPKVLDGLRRRYQLVDIIFKNGKVVAVWPAYLAKQRDDPQIQQQLTMLQWEIALFGPRDCNAGNYKIHFDPLTKKATVLGYDLDDAYNAYIRDPRDLRHFATSLTLPPVADQKIYDAIMAINPNEYRKLLEPLSDMEIRSALSRLQAVKDHLLDLKSKGLVIEPGSPLGGWGSPGVTKLFKRHNSFVGRDCHRYRRQRNGIFVTDADRETI